RSRRREPTTPRTPYVRRSRFRARRTSACLGKATDRCQQLRRLLRCGSPVSGGERTGNAVLHVVVEDRQREALEGGRDRTELGKDVDAVAVVLDHALDPPHLPFDAVQALDECGFVLGVAVGGHAEKHTTRGYSPTA